MSKSKTPKRDAKGLLSGIDYIFDENGLVDWRKMVKPEFLVANNQYTNETDVSKLEDNQLLILLGGIKELAHLRGYTDLRYTVTSPSPEYVVATCTITWLSNYETEGKEVTFSAIGDASPNNTSSFARNYLGPIAENRAFVRCVRNFLRVNIVGKDEIGKSDTSSAEQYNTKSTTLTDPRIILHNLMQEKSVDWDTLKAKLVEEEYKEASKLNSLDDIANIKVFELIERMKKAKIAIKS
tara:strand:+ start:5036 stop:5752 length:717 start_codon:yes stop_codon:yes gene_type:complete